MKHGSKIGSKKPNRKKYGSPSPQSANPDSRRTLRGADRDPQIAGTMNEMDSGLENILRK